MHGASAHACVPYVSAHAPECRDLALQTLRIENRGMSQASGLVQILECRW